MATREASVPSTPSKWLSSKTHSKDMKPIGSRYTGIARWAFSMVVGSGYMAVIGGEMVVIGVEKVVGGGEVTVRTVMAPADVESLNINKVKNYAVFTFFCKFAAGKHKTE